MANDIEAKRHRRAKDRRAERREEKRHGHDKQCFHKISSTA